MSPFAIGRGGESTRTGIVLEWRSYGGLRARNSARRR